VPVAYAVRGPRLSVAQREVLRHLAFNEAIRAVTAGTILHGFRNDGRGCGGTGGKSGCCRWASTDGSAMLRRMRDRGLIRKLRRGHWRRIPRDEWGRRITPE
jgi:hypothetical protein